MLLYIPLKWIGNLAVEFRLTWSAVGDQACKNFSNADLISVHDFGEKSLLNSLAMNNFMPMAGGDNAATGSWIGLYKKDFVIYYVYKR